MKSIRSRRDHHDDSFPFFLFRSPLAGSLDLFEIMLDQGRHLWRLPVGLFRVFRPGEGKVQDLSWLLGLLQEGENLQENLFLSPFISNLADGPSVRIFNSDRTGNTHGPMKFISRGEDNRRKTGLLQIAGSQPHGLAAEGSGRGEKDGLHPLGLHSF